MAVRTDRGHNPEFHGRVDAPAKPDQRYFARSSAAAALRVSLETYRCQVRTAGVAVRCGVFVPNEVADGVGLGHG